jgi:hypothetical protein
VVADRYLQFLPPTSAALLAYTSGAFPANTSNFAYLKADEVDALGVGTYLMSPDKHDAHGKMLLAGRVIRKLRVFDFAAADSPMITPAASGHTGAAFDGTRYVAGQPTAGSPSELSLASGAGALIKRAMGYPGPGADPLGIDIKYYDDDTPEPLPTFTALGVDSVRVAHGVAGTQLNGSWAAPAQQWVLEGEGTPDGDIEVMIRYDNHSWSNGNGSFGLVATDGRDGGGIANGIQHEARITRGRGGNGHLSMFSLGATFGNTSVRDGADNQSAGWLMLKRISGDWETWYRRESDSVWIQVGSTFTNSLFRPRTGAVSIQLEAPNLNATGSTDFSQLTVVKGTVINEIGWKRDITMRKETQLQWINTEREFAFEHTGEVGGVAILPHTKILMVGNRSGVDLINLKPAGPELFHRYDHSNRVVGQAPALSSSNSTIADVWDADMDLEQMLFLASIGGSTTGNLGMLADYHRDEIRDMVPAGAQFGLQYTRLGHWNVRGNIATRNQGMNHDVTTRTLGREEYKIVDVQTHGCSMMRDAVDPDYIWMVIAQNTGISLQRYAPDHQVSKPVLGAIHEPPGLMWSPFMDPVTNELWFLEGTTGGPWTLHSAQKSTLVAALSTNPTVPFAADAFATIENGFSSSSAIGQRMHFVRHGSYVYRCSDAGVQRILWNNGSGDMGAWTLYYGAPGSGATHEILNQADYDSISAISLHGTDDLMVVTHKDTPDNKSVYAVDLTTDQLHELGYLDVTSQLDGYPRSVAA